MTSIPGSRRQLPADLVGDPLGEVVVLRRPQVLERKDGDPPDCGARRRRRSFRRPPEMEDGRDRQRGDERRDDRHRLPPLLRRGRDGTDAARGLRQSERDLAGRLKAFRRFLLEAPPDDALQDRRDVPAGLRQAGRLLPQDRHDHVARAVPLECLPARQELVEDRPEGEDVRALVHGLPAELLGRDVADRPDDRPGRGVPRLGRGVRVGRRERDALGQPEVQDLDVVLGGNEDVFRFQVAVDHALAVRGREPLRDLERIVDRLPLRNRRALEPGAQGLSFQQLGHGEGDPALRLEVVDGQDVRMRQRRHGLGLALEALQRVPVRGQVFRQDLDRDLPLELPVPRPIHLPHPARPEGRKDLVRTEPGPG